MPTPTRLEIAGHFAEALERVTEGQLIVLMDDYAAMLRVASSSQAPVTLAWLEDRYEAIVEEYGRRQATEHLFV